MPDITAAADALAMPRTHSFIEGVGWVAPLPYAIGTAGTIALGDTVSGPCATMGTPHTGTVVRIAWVHPDSGEIRARIQLDDATHRIVVVQTVHVDVILIDDDQDEDGAVRDDDGLTDRERARVAADAADRAADAAVNAAENVHRRDCGSIDATGDYPDCSARCEDADQAAADACERSHAAWAHLRSFV